MYARTGRHTDVNVACSTRGGRQPIHDPLHRTHADPELLRNLDHAQAFALQAPYLGLNRRPDPRPAERFALSPGSGQSCFYPFLNHRSLEFSEHAAHLEERFAGRRGRVYALLVKVEIDTLAMDFPEELDQLL